MFTYTSPDEFKSAYDTLHATYRTGRTKSLKWRRWQLKQLFWMIDDNKDAIAQALKQDLNKHAFETTVYDINGFKAEVLDQLAHVEKWSQGEAAPGAGFIMGTLGKAWIRKEPLGVALIIGTWNYGLYTLTPALAAVAAGKQPVIQSTTSAHSPRQLCNDQTF